MARLQTCKRCKQALLSDARCCPHCAVPRPTSRRKTRNVLFGLLAIAAVALALDYYRSVGGTGGPNVSAIQKPTLAPSSRPADNFKAACLQKGGTVVQVLASQGSSIQRCAIKFIEPE